MRKTTALFAVGGCSFFFLLSYSKRQTLSALSYSYLGFTFLILTLFHLLSASALLEKNKKNVQKSRPKRGKKRQFFTFITPVKDGPK